VNRDTRDDRLKSLKLQVATAMQLSKFFDGVTCGDYPIPQEIPVLR
jgi:hypothetical protein